MARGLFLVLEGGEGSGKSTLQAALARLMRESGRTVIETREPGGTPVGEALRTVLQSDALDPWAETFVFLAARAQLVRSVILPALESGTDVLCDRFFASTFAYQGHGRGLDLTRLRVANTIATDNLLPDLTVLLDLEPALGLQRKHGETDVIATGREALGFHERVRDGYRALAQEARPGTWVTLDASKDAAKVAHEAWKVLWPRVRKQNQVRDRVQ